MADLTSRQEEILALIRSHLAENGAPPTRAEIAAAFGFSSPTAAEGHLRALERKGVIELTSTSRGIRLLEKAGLPIVGKVAAGSPILAEQNLLGHCQIDPSVFKPLAHYLLQVRGESMRDAGILDGDWIAVHRTREARTGQIVVARIDDEVTVKRIKLKGARTELLPENPDFQPIVVDLRRQTFAIEGLYVGLVRR
jgi:repressor LexA